MSSLFFKSFLSPTRLTSRSLNTAFKTSFQMDYEHVVQTINSLQSLNPAFHVIDNKKSMQKDIVKLNVVYDFLARMGITKQNLDKLSIIHVTGTKGKGSTSAFCESILRSHGFRTGFYSSPHLVTIRERIRINGEIMDKENFITHFQEVYSKLKKSQEHEADMPGYFCFLTLMAFSVFIQENVDVVVLEVGIGGLLDYTNVVRNVPSVGISSIGLDHTDILGDTVEKIAYEKSGIMKSGCTAYTVEQLPGAMDVLTASASAIPCLLHVIPKFDEYKWENDFQPTLPANTPEFKTNASLGVQLAHSWMNKKALERNTIYNGSNGNKDKIHKDIVKFLPRETADGLMKCRWPGRFQTIYTSYADFFLDGAHTVESISACIKWYEGCTSASSVRLLLFNTTGVRNSEALMKQLAVVKFENAYFSPNISTGHVHSTNDQFSLFSRDGQLERCKNNCLFWREYYGFNNNNSGIIFHSVSDVLAHIKQDFYKTKHKSSVLITGSLHLIGAALALIDPTLSSHD